MSLIISGSTLNATVQTYQVSGTTQKEEEETTASSASLQNVTATSSQGDTLQISAAGQAASAENQSTDAETDSSSTTEATITDEAAIVAESLSTDEESESTTDLSSYSESELKEMYQNGEITAAEYNNEIARREQESATQTTDSELEDLTALLTNS